MKPVFIKRELTQIAEKLTDDATYEDAIDELYVRMKIARSRQAAQEGHLHAHDDVKKRFLR